MTSSSTPTRSESFDTARASRFVLASGVVLTSTQGGLVASFADGRFRRIDLRDRDLEAALAATAASGGAVPAGELGDAWKILVEQGVLVRGRPARIVDRIGVGHVPAANELATPDEPPLRSSSEAREAVPILLGWLFDPAFHRAVVDVAEARTGATVAAASSAGAWIVHDDGATSPCAHCALLFDAEAARNALGLERLGKSGAIPAPPLELASVLRTWLARWTRGDIALPRPGRALVWDATSATQRWESVAAHPGCSCMAREARACARAPDVDFRTASRRRFTPVVAVSRADGDVPARVVYRGTARSWPIEPAAFGVAMASPPSAPPRAIAEAIERFAMLHAPPDVRGATAVDVGETLSVEAIESLLFRPEERSAPGFPFPAFSRAAPLDWSWATELTTGQRVLVPATLVGRVREPNGRLVHATSNGYACHVERDKAIRGALLEIVERDAILLAFHLSRALPRIEGIDETLGVEGDVRAWLATQDVDLPVVLATSFLDDGRTRIAAAAGATFDEALARTAAELRALVASRSSATRAAGGAPIEGSPASHQAYYDGPGRERLRALAGPATEAIEARALATRWPAEPPSEVPAFASVLRALSRAGLSALVVDRSLPSVFGRRWHVVRALVPGAVELSWGMRFRRLASPRIARALESGERLSDTPHPIA